MRSGKHSQLTRVQPPADVHAAAHHAGVGAGGIDEDTIEGPGVFEINAVQRLGLDAGVAKVRDVLAQASEARFIKVDVDANPDIASEYGVQGIPALLAFKNGNVVARQAGVTDLGTLRGWSERFST